MKMMNNLDPKFFPRPGDPDCTHAIGLYKSGRCRVCGFKVMDSVHKRAWIYGIKLWLMNVNLTRKSRGVICG